jgi:catechol 2,3-dioxygenase-like lactoylglutathione lyase family enzyme
VFDHVGIHVADRAASERFYDAVLTALGIVKDHSGEAYAEWGDFALGAASDADDVTTGLHIGFVAPSRAAVDDFWRVGTAAGYRDDGAPGPRPQYGRTYYGGFLLDPDGNSAEGCVHDAARRGGEIDHVWMRVADVAASKRFYELVAEHARFRLNKDTPEWARFRGDSGSFSVVPGRPTRHAHLAFPVADDARVEAFHRAALEAGYRDNGGPGERPEYHPGYFGAFVLDPDGNNIELVNHNR